MAYAITSSGMNDFLFGIHTGHLNTKADEIARANGCRYVRARDETGKRHGWFVVPNKSDRENSAVRDTVLSAIDVLGGYAALRMRHDSERYTPWQLVQIELHFGWFVTYDEDGNLKRKDPKSTSETYWVSITQEEIAEALGAKQQELT